jgi:hypothetical protein
LKELLNVLQGKSYTVGGQNRPGAIGNWTKHARSANAVPTIDDVDAWAEMWTSWWISLQPATRQGAELLRDVNAGESWADIKKGSINGFYNVMVSLSWWMCALRTDQDREKFALILQDVVWVLGKMLGDQQTTSAKRTLDEVDDPNVPESGPKR